MAHGSLVDSMAQQGIQIDPLTGERAQAGPQIDPLTGERVSGAFAGATVHASTNNPTTPTTDLKANLLRQQGEYDPKGIASGVVKSVVGTARRSLTPPIPLGVNPVIEKLVGMIPPAWANPTSPAEESGKLIGDMGLAMAPAGLIGKGAGALNAIGSRLTANTTPFIEWLGSRLPGFMVHGAAGAETAEAQGANPTLGGVLGAAGSTIPALFGKFVKPLMQAGLKGDTRAASTAIEEGLVPTKSNILRRIKELQAKLGLSQESAAARDAVDSFHASQRPLPPLLESGTDVVDIPLGPKPQSTKFDPAATTLDPDSEMQVLNAGEIKDYPSRRFRPRQFNDFFANPEMPSANAGTGFGGPGVLRREMPHSVPSGEMPPPPTPKKPLNFEQLDLTQRLDELQWLHKIASAPRPSWMNGKDWAAVMTLVPTYAFGGTRALALNMAGSAAAAGATNPVVTGFASKLAQAIASRDPGLLGQLLASSSPLMPPPIKKNP